MWPFTKKKTEPPKEILYSQLDITENFDDHLRLGPNDWIETIPLNLRLDDPESQGLPPTEATGDEIYEVANHLSKFREQIPIASDGVYCPVCHIANVDLNRLRTSCNQCGRGLLKFGWD